MLRLRWMINDEYYCILKKKFKTSIIKGTYGLYKSP